MEVKPDQLLQLNDPVSRPDKLLIQCVLVSNIVINNCGVTKDDLMELITPKIPLCLMLLCQ